MNLPRCRRCGGQVIDPDYDGMTCLQCGRYGGALPEPLAYTPDRYLQFDKVVEREQRVIKVDREKLARMLGVAPETLRRYEEVA